MGQSLNAPSSELLQQLTAIVGTQNAIVDPTQQAPYLREWRDRYVGCTPMVLRPATPLEIAEILRLANQARVGVVPQAGNTGLVGGQIPFETGCELVVSVERLKRVRSVDGNAQTMTVEAGLTLADVQSLAAQAGGYFPLSLAAEGTAQIGGNLATNAGGVGVLAHGNARHLTYGLEVVLADGRVWDGLRALKKDNTGYDLRDLFIGSEGTLGIITAAVLKFLPKPAKQVTAFAGLRDLDYVAALFNRVQGVLGPNLTAFEFIPHIAVEFVTRHWPDTRLALSQPCPWYVLLEGSSCHADTGLDDQIQSVLSNALEAGEAADVVIAASVQQGRDLWRLRELISEAQKPEGGSIKHDVSVPVMAMAEFIRRADVVVQRICPGARPVPFGHFGDGNVHYNVSQPVGMERSAFLDLWETMNESIHELVAGMGGSISAEHGVGRMKRDDLVRFKSDVELHLMRKIKEAFDPNGILNPGKVL